MKLGDMETRVAHEAVPSKRDAKLLMHLTADVKQDSRLVARADCTPRITCHDVYLVQNTAHRPNCGGACTHAGDGRHAQG